MTIQEATEKLQSELEKDVFQVRHDGTSIIVDVAFIYRVKEVEALGDTYEGFPLNHKAGRRSCW